MNGLKAPFPWFGGKSRVAHLCAPYPLCLGRGRQNAGRERIWFSPYCLRPNESLLSGLLEEATA